VRESEENEREGVKIKRKIALKKKHLKIRAEWMER
jgi:hypothetical protein